MFYNTTPLSQDHVEAVIQVLQPWALAMASEEQVQQVHNFERMWAIMKSFGYKLTKHLMHDSL